MKFIKYYTIFRENNTFTYHNTIDDLIRLPMNQQFQLTIFIFVNLCSHDTYFSTNCVFL